MRHLIARNPKCEGMVGWARTLREARDIAESVARTSATGEAYIIHGRDGSIIRVQFNRTTGKTTTRRIDA